MMSYDETMAAGAAEYADALAALRELGLHAEFVQTGGMCAALEAKLEGGYLLITDEEDTLSWSRADHAGWFVGIYKVDPATEDSELTREGQTSESDVAALVALVNQVMGMSE